MWLVVLLHTSGISAVNGVSHLPLPPPFTLSPLFSLSPAFLPFLLLSPSKFVALSSVLCEQSLFGARSSFFVVPDITGRIVLLVSVKCCASHLGLSLQRERDKTSLVKRTSIGTIESRTQQDQLLLGLPNLAEEGKTGGHRRILRHG